MVGGSNTSEYQLVETSEAESALVGFVCGFPSGLATVRIGHRTR